MNTRDLQLKSIEYRKTILEIIYNGKAGHTAGSLSCIDILNVLYNKILNIITSEKKGIKVKQDFNQIKEIVKELTK